MKIITKGDKLNNNNNINDDNTNSTQFFINNMLAQQPYGHLQRQQRNITKIHK